MPFPHQTPQSFTALGVSSVSDTLMGVYGLFRDQTWIYVGKGEIKNRLQAHLRGDVPCIIHERATHFVMHVMVLGMDERERELIRELDPICNERVG